jgi:hypothetical protein
MQHRHVCRRSGRRIATFDPDLDASDAEGEQPMQEVVPGSRIEIGPDLRPGLAHEPPSDGDVKARHEAGQEQPQGHVRTSGLKPDAWHQHPADGEGEKRASQCAELDGSFLAEARDQELDPRNAVQGFRADQDDAQRADAKQCLRAHEVMRSAASPGATFTGRGKATQCLQ